MISISAIEVQVFSWLWWDFIEPVILAAIIVGLYKMIKQFKRQNEILSKIADALEKMETGR